MTGSLSDTHPDIEAMQIRLLREMPAWRRLQIMSGLIQMARGLAWEGLRERYPCASEDELRWRFVALHYGSDLAERVYGPPPWEESSSGA